MPPIVSTKLSEKVQFISWMDDRLPEMLWAALIVASFDRSHALSQFRRILKFIGEHERKDQFHDVTLTGIGNLDATNRCELIGFLTEPPGVSRALSTLLLFEGLPGREDWEKHLSTHETDVALLMGSVGAVLWQQSREAADCRWMRVMAKLIAGRLSINPELETLDLLLNYPATADEDRALSAVRLTEMNLNGLLDPDLAWPKAFWHEAWMSTPCIRSTPQVNHLPLEEAVTRQSISELRERLEIHWQQTHSTTEIDSRHDAVFGVAFYCLRILEEMMGIGIGSSVLGRLGLRTILEARINLQYMLVEDKPDLWKAWREYGAGQAKLNALKFDESIEPPQYIDLESIESIASEDIWSEYRTVNLASWSGLDLRKISERSGLKDTYDQHYSWTSGYAHGMWGAVRESCFQTCVNPLHRLHGHPQRSPLKDTVDDAAILVDEIMQQVDTAYPTFTQRLLMKRPLAV